jgi:hypothetical protein
MKKLFSMLLALTMLLSLCVPVFAEESHTITSQEYPLYIMGGDLG